MAKSDPIDVDVTFGYSDGTLRTHYIKGFVVEQGAKVIGIQPHRAEEPTVQQHSGKLDLWKIMTFAGLAILIYNAAGSWGLLAAGCIALVCRGIFRTAKQQHTKKVLDAHQRPKVTTGSIRSES
jgi:hypothetical protein